MPGHRLLSAYKGAPNLEKSVVHFEAAASGTEIVFDEAHRLAVAASAPASDIDV